MGHDWFIMRHAITNDVWHNCVKPSMLQYYDVNDDIKWNYFFLMCLVVLSLYFDGRYQFGAWYLQVTVKEKKSILNNLPIISFCVPQKQKSTIFHVELFHVHLTCIKIIRVITTNMWDTMCLCSLIKQLKTELKHTSNYILKFCVQYGV